MVRRNTRRHVTGTEVTTKSWFGSHAEMVVEEINEKEVMCEDQLGRYKTLRDRLDNGLADPNRYSNRK
tara:strand:+ start:1771 stop:1974 length:204 start_codon:yes stop_codon:yes gene_type:complete